MTHRILSALLLSAAIAAPSAVFAQQPAPAPKPAAPKPAAPKPAAQQKPAAPAAQAPQAQQQQQPPAQQGQQQMPQLIYSAWLKVCNKPQDPNMKPVCVTGRNVSLETGQPIVAASLIEPEGEPKKIFRVAVPAPVLLNFGTGIVIDQNPGVQAAYVTCFPNGLCISDYEASADLITKLKKGTTLGVQYMNVGGNQVTIPMALADFAKVNEGPPTDPKVVEEQQKKAQDELQKRADELRKKLEAQQQQQQPPKQ